MLASVHYRVGRELPAQQAWVAQVRSPAGRVPRPRRICAELTNAVAEDSSHTDERQLPQQWCRRCSRSWSVFMSKFDDPLTDGPAQERAATWAVRGPWSLEHRTSYSGEDGRG